MSAARCFIGRSYLSHRASAALTQMRHTMKTAGALGAAKRPQYLFSGLTKCGICGAGFIMSGKNRLGCFGARDQGRCDNHLTIRRDEVEARVLRALQEKLLQQDLFEDFCDEFAREMNRLRMAPRHPISRRAGDRADRSPAQEAGRGDHGRHPGQGELQIELKGNLAAMLTVAQQTKRSPETGDLLMPVQMVAGLATR